MNHLVEDFLQGVDLRVGSTLVRVVEIEVYRFPDPYLHGQPEQKFQGRWYFHKSGNTEGPTGFKGGTYKGLDLTWGTSEAPGGFLIRSILASDNLIEGPCKVVEFILAQTNCVSISELVSLSSEYPPRCDDVNFPLHLVDAVRRTDPLYSGPRVGLSYREEDLSKKYFGANLRFTIYPHLSKNKFSLVLSFLQSKSPLADLIQLDQEDQTNPENPQKIVSETDLDEYQLWAAMQTFKVNQKTIERWWSDFNQGRTQPIVGGSTVPEQCRLYASLWS